MLSTAKRRRPSAPSESKQRPDRRPLEIAVLLGGVGSERDVSLVSGSEVAKALRTRGHTVHEVVIESSDGAFLRTVPSTTEVAFIALHGEFGEDGTIQHLLARAGVPYTGSGPEASARAFDKLRTKRLLARAGVPMAWHRVLEFPFGERAVRHAVRMTPPGRVVVKPARAGSSVGVVVCRAPNQLRRALDDGARFRQHLMIEEFIPGRELTCGILDDTPLPVVEAVPRRGFFDYTAKYDKGSGTEYVVDPSDLPAPVRQRIQEVALECHRVLGCDDFSRVDFRYDPTQDRLAVLEVNTIPGMTPTSLLPKAAAAAGLDFAALVERLSRLALRYVAS